MDKISNDPIKAFVVAFSEVTELVLCCKDCDNFYGCDRPCGNVTTGDPCDSDCRVDNAHEKCWELASPKVLVSQSFDEGLDLGNEL